VCVLNCVGNFFLCVDGLWERARGEKREDGVGDH
jgi:hypothetical protein